MSKTTDRVTTTDTEIDAAIANAKLYDQQRPQAVGVAYRKTDDMTSWRYLRAWNSQFRANCYRASKAIPPK